MPDDFTADPDLDEAQRIFHLPMHKAEEPGRQQAKPTLFSALSPCPICGLPVAWGQTDQGQLIAVEPETLTYVMVWDRGTSWPRLCQSRGYPAHACPPSPERRG